MKYCSDAFEKYISKNICFNTTFYDSGKTFFYCKKEIGVDIKEIKEKFPGIIFLSNDLNYNFTLEADDLFFENEDFIFCLLYFDSTWDPSWKMGKPFLKKYQFIFNFD